MSNKDIVRRFKGFEITACADGTAKLKQEGLPEINLNSFTWMQVKDSIKEGKFELPNK